ncbi:Retrovirus-related Pol polyprotein, partial [Aphis craccivora]
MPPRVSKLTFRHGADLNLIQLDTLSDNVKVNTDRTYSLQGIHKTPVTTMGSVQLDIHIGNSTQPTEFQAVIDCKQGTLTWDIPTNEITVPPRSQVVIPVCTTNIVGDNRDVLIHSQQLAEDLFCGNVPNT